MDNGHLWLCNSVLKGMTVLQTVNSLDASAGGPSRTVSSTARALAEVGVDVHLVTSVGPTGEEALFPPADVVHVSTVPATPLWAHITGFYRQVRDCIREHGVQLVQDNGVWLLSNWATFRAARAEGVPYVLAPKGMLEPWALQHHAWRKNVAWYAYQRRILHGAALLSATAAAEATQLRRIGLKAPILVVPNGVSVPKEWKQTPTGGAKRQALFLSRVHPKKGLLNLIEAWAAVRPDYWRMVIAGPYEGNHRAAVESAAVAHGIGDIVSFTGRVPDKEKWALYRASDLFVLPTFSENFGVVVAEALASGIPVITTTGAPWASLRTHDCGWWIEIGVEPLQQALRDATAISDERRLEMGRQGRALVQQRFTWPAIAETIAGAYQWLLDSSIDRPPTVIPEGATVADYVDVHA